MRYRLRTLLIVLAVGPPLLAGAWIATSRAVQMVLDFQGFDTYEVLSFVESGIGSAMAVGLLMVVITLARRACGPT